MKFMLKYADNNCRDSLACKMRKRRFEYFKKYVLQLPKPIKILDIGGTQEFWEMMDFVNEHSIQITLLNIDHQQIRYFNFESIIGSVTELLCFSNFEFDVVFSNSVIEHVGPFWAQKKMADQIVRIGKRFFVQTPNYFFPIEPHFLVPGFQWLPLNIRAFLLKYFNLGWYKKTSNYESAMEDVSSVHLLTKGKLAQLFPSGKIIEEKFLGFTKSFIITDIV